METSNNNRETILRCDPRQPAKGTRWNIPRSGLFNARTEPSRRCLSNVSRRPEELLTMWEAWRRPNPNLMRAASGRKGDLLRCARNRRHTARGEGSRSSRPRGCRRWGCPRSVWRGGKWRRLAHARRACRRCPRLPIATSDCSTGSETNRAGYARRLSSCATQRNRVRVLHDGAIGNRRRGSHPGARRSRSPLAEFVFLVGPRSGIFKRERVRHTHLSNRAYGLSLGVLASRVNREVKWPRSSTSRGSLKATLASPFAPRYPAGHPILLHNLFQPIRIASVAFSLDMSWVRGALP